MTRAARAAKLLTEHRRSLLGTARRFSACGDDAEDAVQRAIEILLRKGPEDAAPPQLLGWMHVVVRREALAIRRERRDPAGRGEPLEGSELDRVLAPAPGPEARLEARDRVEHVARLLAVLKPQERRALALQGAGCSYAEIQAITGWTYTKVNRCIAEGREALRRLEPLAPTA